MGLTNYARQSTGADGTMALGASQNPGHESGARRSAAGAARSERVSREAGMCRHSRGSGSTTWQNAVLGPVMAAMFAIALAAAARAGNGDTPPCAVLSVLVDAASHCETPASCVILYLPVA